MSFKIIYLAKRNPSIEFENWPFVWRSHAYYVLSNFPYAASIVDKLFYCSRMNDSFPGFCQDYDGVGLVFSAPNKAMKKAYASAIEERVEADERRVFSSEVRNFAFSAEEVFSMGDSFGKAVVIHLLVRGAGLTREDFDERLAGRYREIAENLVVPNGPVLRHSHESVADTPPGYPFDAVTLSWLETPDSALEAVKDGLFAPLMQDIAEFCDMQRSVSLLTHVFHRWPH